MKPIYPNWPIYVGWSKRLDCRGVLATRAIKAGEMIEVCPVILIEYPGKKVGRGETLNHNLLDNYYYEWNDKYWSIPLGYGVLYNHSYHANAIYSYDYVNKLIKFRAVSDISPDEEVTVNYNDSPDDQTPIDDWFGEYNGRKIV